MKKRTVLTMILAVTIISGILSGCGEKKESAKEPSAKAEQLSITDNNNEKGEIATDSITINVSADNGWDADSTPAILHIAAKDIEDTEFYHAINPDEEGGKGSTTVSLAEGTYDVEFISPLNLDGSDYEIYDMGTSQEITVKFGRDRTVDCEMKQIPVEQVTDEMIADIITKMQTAVAKGDETLKGGKAEDILARLALNVQNSLNASEETKKLVESVKVDIVDFTPQEEAKTNGIEVTAEKVKQDTNQIRQGNQNVQNNNTQNNITANINNKMQNNATVNNNQNTESTQPSMPAVTESEQTAHTHTWVDHVVTTQEWIANIVTVPDYETKEVPYWHCSNTMCDENGTLISTPCHMEFRLETEEDERIVEEHAIAHLLSGEPSCANGYGFLKTETVQVGSHTEDQGHYETKTTVDYRYCTGCGAKK